MFTGTLTVLFIAVGGVGLVLLILSFLLGGDADTGGGVEADANSGGGKMPVSLSLSVVSAGLVGFGVAGWIADANGVPWAVALLCAVGGAACLSAVMHFAVLGPLARQQSNSMTGRQSYVGLLASVTLRIPAEGFGEVVFSDASKVRVSERAWSQDGTAIPTGITVVIQSVTEGGVIVVRQNP